MDDIRFESRRVGGLGLLLAWHEVTARLETP